MALSSLGLGSGLDAESIVTQLVAVERQPITKLQTLNKSLDAKISSWGTIQSAFSTLQSAADALTQNSTWGAVTATSAKESVVSVTAGTGSTAGSYSVKVQALAASQFLTSPVQTSSAAKLGAGTLTIQLGTWKDAAVQGDPPTFDNKASTAAVSITVGADDTLENIRDAINKATAGVKASIVNDSSGARLVLKGESGAENGFMVSVADADGTNTDLNGLSALAYDPRAGSLVSNMARTQAAADAKATINGIAVTSTTNKLKEVLDGLTLTLGAVSADAVDVTVAQDNAAIKKNIDSFVSAYNGVVSQIRTQSLYDEASKTGGPLQGDSAARTLLGQLRSLVSSGSTASSVFGRLPDVGLDIAKDGTLSVVAAKQTTALANLGEMRKLIGADYAATDAGNGLATRIRDLAKVALNTDSAITVRKNGLSSTKRRNETQVTAMQTHIAGYETRLRAQYTALDQSMTKLSGLSSYVSRMLASLN